MSELKVCFCFHPTKKNVEKKTEDCWNQTHGFLWNFVSNLVGLVEETQGGDVAQRRKTPEEEEGQWSIEVKQKKKKKIG